MKTSALFCAATSVVVLCLPCAGEPTAQPPDPPYAFARGWANLLGGWLEIPRGIIYENTCIPLVGFAAGPVKGAFLALWRTLAGGMDVLCFGVTRQGLYTRDVPEFVWDAEWLPACAGAHAVDAGPAQQRRGLRAARRASGQQSALCAPVPPCAAAPVPPCTAAPAPPTPSVRRVEAPAAAPVPAARPARRTMPLPPSAALAVTGTVCASSSDQPPQAMPQSAPSAEAAPDTQAEPFALSSDEAMDARIQAMEQSVRDIERRAAIFN